MSPHVVSFRFAYRTGETIAFRLVSRLVRRIVCVGVPLLVLFLVSCCRSVRVSWASVLVSAFRLSCRRWRLASHFAFRLVLSSRLIGRLVLRFVVASRGGVSLCFSFSRLVVAFCRLVSFRSSVSCLVSPFVLFSFCLVLLLSLSWRRCGSCKAWR